MTRNTRSRVRMFALTGLSALATLTACAALATPAWAAAPRPDSDKAYEHRSRGQELEKTGHLGAALVEYRTALRFDRNDVESSWRAGVMELRLGRPHSAIPLLERATKGHLDAGGAEEIDLARAYEQASKVKQAKEVLEREAAENPTFIRVQLALIGLFSRQGQCEEAQARLSKLDKNPALEKKEFVTVADDARTDVRTNCSAQAKR